MIFMFRVKRPRVEKTKYEKYIGLYSFYTLAVINQGVTVYCYDSILFQYSWFLFKLSFGEGWVP